MSDDIEIKPGDRVRHKGKDYFIIRDPYQGFLVGFTRKEGADQVNIDVLAFRAADCVVVTRGAEPEGDCLDVWRKLPGAAREKLLAAIRAEARKS